LSEIQHSGINKQSTGDRRDTLVEISMRNVPTFSFQRNENNGDKHEIVSIPFTKAAAMDLVARKVTSARCCTGWPNCCGL